jgi:D-arabinose 1-dehydrogenase-like Zn-dependent alcohol dehydrogenase
MQAALFYEPRKPLKVENTDTPPVGDNDVLVKVRASGLCDTDHRFITFGLPFPVKGPQILGHQIAGEVEKVGAQVKSVAKGDAVVVHFLIKCGRCYYCVRGMDQLCEQWQAVGAQRSGGFGEYVSVPEANAIKVSKQLSAAEASLIPCGLGTPYRLFQQLRVKHAETAIILEGRLWGLTTIQMCHMAGARAILLDDEPKRLEQAKEIGADAVFDLNAQDMPDRVRQVTGGQGADVVLDYSGNPKTIARGMDVIRKAGRLGIVGRAACFEPVTIDIFKFMFGEIWVTGGCLANELEVRQLAELASQKKFDLAPFITHRVTLPEINEGFEMMEKIHPISVVMDM